MTTGLGGGSREGEVDRQPKIDSFVLYSVSDTLDTNTPKLLVRLTILYLVCALAPALQVLASWSRRRHYPYLLVKMFCLPLHALVREMK